MLSIKDLRGARILLLAGFRIGRRVNPLRARRILLAYLSFQIKIYSTRLPKWILLILVTLQKLVYTNAGRGIFDNVAGEMALGLISSETNSSTIIRHLIIGTLVYNNNIVLLGLYDVRLS
jgi:hypothetical protein